MLRNLHIENYVLIDNLDVEFPEGLVVISGPTGAGKSILIGALGLLLGAKADASVISGDSSSCIVEGEFLSPSAQIEEICRENDLQYDSGHYIIRRVVASSGRSRAFFNDDPLPSSLLEKIGSFLVDIHSQHDTLLLSSKAYQLSVLDCFCSNGELLSRCREAYGALGRLDAQITRLKEEITRAESEKDYNEALLSKLESASLREGELAELEAEQYSLSHSEQIRELLLGCSEIFSPGDEQLRGLNASLSALKRQLDTLSQFVPSLSSFPSRVEASRIDLKDISDEIAGLCSRVDSSPERLQYLDDRIATIYSLMKRHGVSSEADLIEKRDSLRLLCCDSEKMQETLDELSSKREECLLVATEAASALHDSRASMSVKFSQDIEASLQYMELEGSKFTVDLERVELGPTGYDQATFLFQSRGARPSPVAKCASGGELSRIMLALKETMSGFMDMPTMVFDEIDTGVSGSVAARMGSVICKMGGKMQVFAITHLPQVAAKGQAHYLVSKSSSGPRAVSTIKKLSPEERVLEVARMLSGTSLTQEAIANAKSLLG